MSYSNKESGDHCVGIFEFEDKQSDEVIAGSACTECNCNYFKADLDKDITGFTCRCGHMKSAHWR